jgi:Tetratricopeptide repeat
LPKPVYHPYSDIGRRQEAVELSGKVLEVRQRTLGGEHPETLRAIRSLGHCYFSPRYRQEAIELR